MGGLGRGRARVRTDTTLKRLPAAGWLSCCSRPRPGPRLPAPPPPPATPSHTDLESVHGGVRPSRLCTCAQLRTGPSALTNPPASGHSPRRPVSCGTGQGGNAQQGAAGLWESCACSTRDDPVGIRQPPRGPAGTPASAALAQRPVRHARMHAATGPTVNSQAGRQAGRQLAQRPVCPGPRRPAPSAQCLAWPDDDSPGAAPVGPCGSQPGAGGAGGAGGGGQGRVQKRLLAYLFGKLRKAESCRVCGGGGGSCCWLWCSCRCAWVAGRSCRLASTRREWVGEG